MQLSYGNIVLEVHLPKGRYDVLSRRGVSQALDANTHIRKALDSPIESEPLHRLALHRRNAVILISDGTRLCPSYLFLPALLDELNHGGIPDERITVVVSIGLHRRQTTDELIQLTGPVYERVRVVNHSAVSEDCVYVGTTTRGTPVEINRIAVEADLLIATGNIEPHRLVGMSGGVKALFPGAASARSIEAHHAMSHRFKAEPGNPNNPLREDLEEMLSFVPLHYLFNLIVDEHRAVLGAFAGHPIAAHRRGVSVAQSSFLLPVTRLYDAVIVSAGGTPKDIQMYQAIKTLENAAGFTKPGGTLVMIARCEELYGNGTFQLWAETYGNRQQALEQLQQRFVIGAHKLLLLDQVLQKHTVYLYSDMPNPIASLLGFHPIGNLQAAVDRLFAELGDTASIAVMPFGSITFPYRM